MRKNILPPLGILQGRLTPSLDGSIQFFPQNWQNEFALARAIGFSCLEWLIKGEEVESNPLLDPAGSTVIRKLSDYHQLEILSVHAFFEKNQLYSSILAKIIRAAAGIGAKTVLVSFFKQNSLASQANQDLAQAQLSLVLPLCAQLDMR